MFAGTSPCAFVMGDGAPRKVGCVIWPMVPGRARQFKMMRYVSVQNASNALGGRNAVFICLSEGIKFNFGAIVGSELGVLTLLELCCKAGNLFFEEHGVFARDA
jgi:hypothetical protein